MLAIMTAIQFIGNMSREVTGGATTIDLLGEASRLLDELIQWYKMRSA